MPMVGVWNTLLPSEGDGLTDYSIKYLTQKLALF